MHIRFAQIGLYSSLILSAASALLYEVAATKVFFFYFLESSHSFATVVAIFLFGLGVGSFAIYWFFSKINDARIWFVFLQIATALYAALVLAQVDYLLRLMPSLGVLLSSFFLLFVPAAFLGAAFPLAGRLFPEESSNRVVGLVYAVDLFGAIAGALITGFVLLPKIGAHASILVGASLNFFSAAAMLVPRQKWFFWILIGSGFLTCIFATYPLRSVFLSSDGTVPLFSKNSPYGTVAIGKEGNLTIDGWEQCSANYPRDASERMMADYALATQESRSAVRLLNVGLGCGLTAARALEYPRVSVDIVEINPVVAEANRLISDVLQSDRMRLTIDDGLRYMKNTAVLYDAILIDIEDPRILHSSKLYTVEAFKIAAQALTEDGALAFWTFAKPDGDPTLVSRYKDVLYYSLREAFPFVYDYPGVFLATKHPLLGAPSYTPVGSKELNTVDRNVLGEIFPDMNWSHR